MKIECNVIKDLLPLCVDDCCSAESRQLIEEHLKICENCNISYEHMKSSNIDENVVIDCGSERNHEIIMKRGIKKIRRIWIMSLVIVVLMVPILIMTINEVKGEGRCFTNIDDRYKSKMFLNAIENGNYEKAFNYIDIDRVYKIEINQYREIAKEYFIKDMQLLEAFGIKISDSKFSSAYKKNNEEWWVEYMIYMEKENGSKEYIGRLAYITTATGITPASSASVINRNLNYQPTEIDYLMDATHDWRYETYDNLYNDNQFEPVKEKQPWR